MRYPSSIPPYLRERCGFIEKQGAEVLGYWATRKSHWRIRVSKNGVVATLTLPFSHGKVDPRGARNWEAQVRKIIAARCERKPASLTPETGASAER